MRSMLSTTPFTLWPITSPAGEAGLPGQPPKLKTLKEHDVVIWSAPFDSPGVVGASSDLSAYLWAGGRLLVSGQDVAYLDGGGPAFNPLASYFYSDMGLAWAGEGNLAPLTGAHGGPLAGITVTMNTSDSARNQLHPDSVMQRSPTQTVPALIWPDTAIGGALAGACRPYRAAWLGFGLEGAGPRAGAHRDHATHPRLVRGAARAVWIRGARPARTAHRPARRHAGSGAPARQHRRADRHDRRASGGRSMAGGDSAAGRRQHTGDGTFKLPGCATGGAQASRFDSIRRRGRCACDVHDHLPQPRRSDHRQDRST